MPSKNYRAGVCNINKTEAKKRLMTALMALIISLIGLIYFLFFINNVYLRLILIGPIFIAVLGFIQSRQKFCVFYGLTRQENSDENSQKPHQISHIKNYILDRKYSIKLILLSLLIAIIISWLTTFIPEFK